ncbi:metal-dependent hydrolase [Halomicrobium salinisoli]|uniref:metal-dependent hydrolase n=1 Tax=Halomicrobium salinisoli TaxID=2878391 RepID=UPI001CF057FB|nr:metal-dependent hydrolase [Halomicrobium salinisoli]
MWPWGHAAVGYLLYSLLVRADGRAPSSAPVVALAFGTQFPDVIDKPLGWTFGLLPAGRSLAHSMFALLAVSAVAVGVARRYGRPAIGVAFGVGAVSHSFADGLYAVVTGQYADLSYLGWPLLPAPVSEVEQSFVAHVALLEFDWHFALELALVVLAAAAWLRDGRPGLDLVRSVLGGNGRPAEEPDSGD